MVKNPSFQAARKVSMRRINGAHEFEDEDFLATEEPLEIRVEGHSIAVVMRTPGEDDELAAGFLVTEGLVKEATDIVEIRRKSHCRKSEAGAVSEPANTKSDSINCNLADVRLKNPEKFDLKKLTRHVFTSSSCGICSKATIEAVHQQFPPIDNVSELDPQVLLSLPGLLSGAQETFKRTGGLHACALFDFDGKLWVLREDVGRHNALDKVVGWALLNHHLPLGEHILLLSGRTSFEMLQKALAARIPVVAAISAPSSLAAEFARQSGQTLIGFLREGRMNIYAGSHRVRPLPCKQMTGSIAA